MLLAACAFTYVAIVFIDIFYVTFENETPVDLFNRRGIHPLMEGKPFVPK